MSIKSTIKSSNDFENSLTKNVFVTQINERDGEAFERRIPIVKDSPGRLVKTGLNTYQETLVIKQEDELEKVDFELLLKRKKFEEKMAQSREKEASIRKKQETLIQQMDTFGSFIRDNEAKRRRALARYQNEKKQLQHQRGVHDDLKKEIDHYGDIHHKMLVKVKRNKIHQDFLLEAVDLFPQDYIKISDNVLHGLIMRYNTLFGTNNSLIDDMSVRSEEIHKCSRSITQLKQQHANKMLQNNLRLSELYAQYENVKERHERADQEFRMKYGDLRNASLNDGLVLRAINNITKKCVRRYNEQTVEEEYDKKLELIQDYIEMTKEVLEIAKSIKDDRPLSGTPQKESRSTEARSRSKSRPTTTG